MDLIGYILDFVIISFNIVDDYSSSTCNFEFVRSLNTFEFSEKFLSSWEKFGVPKKNNEKKMQFNSQSTIILIQVELQT